MSEGSGENFAVQQVPEESRGNAIALGDQGLDDGSKARVFQQMGRGGPAKSTKCSHKNRRTRHNRFQLPPTISHVNLDSR